MSARIFQYGITSIIPGSAEGYLKRGAAYLNKGDYDRASADFFQILNIGPNLNKLPETVLDEIDRLAQAYGFDPKKSP